jgi:hypothetical protein
MSAASPKLLGAVLQLVTREAASWKAAGGASGPREGSGGASSTSANGVLEAKDEVEVELQKLISSGLEASSVQRSMRAALLAGIDSLFKRLCNPEVLNYASPSVLGQSATVVVLSLIQAAHKESSGARRDGFPSFNGAEYACKAIIAASSLFKIAREQKKEEESACKMATLIEYSVSQICVEKWGVEDAWDDVKVGPIDTEDTSSPLSVAAKTGNLPLLRAAFDNAKSASVSVAALHAFGEGITDAFDFLIQKERCRLDGKAWLWVPLFESLKGSRGEEPSLRERREEMLDRFVRRWPDDLETLWPWKDETCHRALEVAISSRAVRLVDTLLSLGSRIRCEKNDIILDGKSYAVYPTAYYALRFPSLPMMKLLVGHGMLKDWQAKYDEKALDVLGTGLRATILSSYPQLTSSSRSREFAPYRSDGLETLDLVLSTGFSHSWLVDEEGAEWNICMSLVGRDEAVMAEEHILDILSRCRAAGMDMLHLKREDSRKAHGSSLVVLAARSGLNKLLDFAIEVQGPGSVDDWVEGPNKAGKLFKTTPLSEAMGGPHMMTVKHLLGVHKAKAAYRTSDLTAFHQPIIHAVNSDVMGDDETALPFVQELIRADPLLCDLDCFRAEGTATPVYASCTSYFPKCLETLLAAELSGVQEMLLKPVRQKGPNGGSVEVTPAQALAFDKRWDVLTQFLRHCPNAPVATPGRVLHVDGTVDRELALPSVLGYAEKNGAPRLLLAQLKAMAKEQQKAAAEKAKVIAAKSDVPSNAFEDPAAKANVLTAAEEKKKAKRREQKKKAKAKKRAAAAAVAKEGNAGAGKEEGGLSGSDSDSSGPDDDEEGMDEEERMLARAPTFDLEREKAVRKARAEAEKDKETKE